MNTRKLNIEHLVSFIGRLSVTKAELCYIQLCSIVSCVCGNFVVVVDSFFFG